MTTKTKTANATKAPARGGAAKAKTTPPGAKDATPANTAALKAKPVANGRVFSTGACGMTDTIGDCGRVLGWRFAAGIQVRPPGVFP